MAGEKGFSKVEDPDAFKKRLKEQNTSKWLGKPLSGWRGDRDDGLYSTGANTMGKLDKTLYLQPGCITNV